MIEMTRDRVRLMLDEVFTMWGGMHAVEAHHAECLKHTDEIIAAFKTSDTADEVVAKLVLVEGIGVTIATGILWAFDPDRFVPFDKKTTGYCAMRKWITSDNLRFGYEKISKRIVDAAVGAGKEFETIRNLVLEAEELDDDFWVTPNWR